MGDNRFYFYLSRSDCAGSGNYTMSGSANTTESDLTKVYGPKTDNSVTFLYPWITNDILNNFINNYDRHSLNYHNAYRTYIEYFSDISDAGFNFTNWTSFNAFLPNKINTYNSEQK